MSQTYDLVVIGAGSGGVRAARMAASYGARTAIVEEYRVGGTCVIRGCVPKKLLVYASRFSEAFGIARGYGWDVSASFDWPTLIANKDREIARLERAYMTNLDKAGVEIIKDRAVVTGPNSVELVNSGQKLDARYILIATGGRPFRPEIDGEQFGITSNDAFHLDTLPDSILIEGAGYIAVEFAGIFAGLGVKTTLSYRGDCILRGFDQDLRGGLEEGMRARGIEILYQHNIARIEPNGTDRIVDFKNGDRREVGTVMFATGRRPNTEALGLEEAGVELDMQGAVQVDENFKSSCDSIYAVGDVNGRAALTPVAIREGAAVAETLFNDNPTAVDLSMVPTAVFSEPEIGTVGLTEEQAAEQGDIDVYIARFRPMINVLSDKPERMMIKLITAPDKGKVLGCHILGPDAGEMVQLVGIPMTMGATKADIDRTIAVHPTAAEELVTFKSPSHVYRNGKKSG